MHSQGFPTYPATPNQPQTPTPPYPHPNPVYLPSGDQTYGQGGLPAHAPQTEKHFKMTSNHPTVTSSTVAVTPLHVVTSHATPAVSQQSPQMTIHQV